MIGKIGNRQIAPRNPDIAPDNIVSPCRSVAFVVSQRRNGIAATPPTIRHGRQIVSCITGVIAYSKTASDRQSIFKRGGITVTAVWTPPCVYAH